MTGKNGGSEELCIIADVRHVEEGKIVCFNSGLYVCKHPHFDPRINVGDKAKLTPLRRNRLGQPYEWKAELHERGFDFSKLAEQKCGDGWRFRNPLYYVDPATGCRSTKPIGVRRNHRNVLVVVECTDSRWNRPTDAEVFFMANEFCEYGHMRMSMASEPDFVNDIDGTWIFEVKIRQ